MRRDVEDKARGNGNGNATPPRMDGETCSRCGQVGRGCRDVPLGLFCAQWGLIQDESRYLRPTPDPITPAEAKVYARFEPKIADAEAAAAEAAAPFEEASAAWQAAFLERDRQRAKAGDVTFTADGRMIHPKAGSELAEAEAALALAEEAREEVARTLERARLRHAAVVREREAALRRARDEKGTLQRIKEKLS